LVLHGWEEARRLFKRQQLARTRSARMRLPQRQWEDEGTRSNIALVAQAAE
jgi:hypothetical protein